MPKPIYLESDEEITSIVNRLKKEQEDALALVVPAGAILLSSIINLRLLREKAQSLGKKISIVTTDRTGGAIASQVGLSVFETLGEAKEAKETPPEEEYSQEKVFSKKIVRGSFFDRKDEDTISQKPKSRTSIFDGSGGEEKDFGRSATRQEGASPLFAPKKAISTMPSEKDVPGADSYESHINSIKRLPKAKIVMFAGGAIIIFLILATFLFPHATVYVNVYAREQEMTLSFKLNADKDKVAKETKNTLLASWQTKEQSVSLEFDATGQRNVGDKAHGTISVYNRTGKAYSVQANSEFKSQEKTFVNRETVVIPAADISDFGEVLLGKVTFEVEAVEGGVAYNIPAGKFSVLAVKDLANLIYGVSDQPMTGGTDRQAKVVTQEDLNGAQDKVEEEAKKKIEEEFGIKGDEIFVKGLAETKIVQTDSSKKVFEEADKFTVTSKVQFSFLSFMRSDFDKMLTESTPLMISDQNMIIGDGYRSISWEVIKFDSSAKAAEMIARPRVLVGSKVKEDFLKAKLSGLNIPEIRNVLSQYPETELVNVRFFPPILVKTSPADENKISVKIKYIEQ